MIIDQIEYSEREGALRLGAEAAVESVSGVRLHPWFDFTASAGRIEVVGDPFLAGLLVPCMFQGENLRVNGPVSAKLLQGIDEIQSILCSWYPHLQRIEVSATQLINDQLPEKPGDVGCFFSAGVDAWYTLSKHQDRVKQLVLVRGFDIPVDSRDEIWDQTLEQVRSIGRSMGKSVIDVRTNIRKVGDMRRGRAGWGREYDGDFFGECQHGGCLAAVALCLQKTIGEIYVGATYSYDHLEPWGSHPLIDPLWSTGALKFMHDGAEANRMQKIRRIAEHQFALTSMRVCYENRELKYNCCECEKCCRTMMALRACGKLKEATAFPHTLNLTAVRRRLYDAHHYPWYRAIIPDAEKSGDTELVEALEIVVGDRFSMDQTVAKLRSRLQRLLPARAQSMLDSILSRQRWKARLSRTPQKSPGIEAI